MRELKEGNGQGSLHKEEIIVGGIAVEVWRRPVKNFNLVVSGPEGRVRISVPSLSSVERVHQVLLERLDWIIRKRRSVCSVPVVVPVTGSSGELHWLWGQQVPLQVVEGGRRHYVSVAQEGALVLHVRAGTGPEARLRLLGCWYREELRARTHTLLVHWQPLVGRRVQEFRIKKMKTRWGTCNITAGRLWVNLELVKRSVACLELVIVHELVHLLERDHTIEFYGHLDRLLPQWRVVENLLQEPR